MQSTLINRSLSYITRRATNLYLERFVGGKRFLHGKFEVPFGMYGYDCDERCIEIPWALSMLSLLKVKSVLEIGFVRARPKWIRTLKTLNESGFEVSLIDIRPVEDMKAPVDLVRDMRIYQSDIVDFSPEKKFDAVFLISTLEHFGKDDHLIKIPRGSPPKATGASAFLDHEKDISGLRTISRLINQEGSIICTVPFGRLADYGSHICYDRQRINQLLAECGLYEYASTFFKYTPQGWKACEEHDIQDALYFDQGARAASGLGCFVFKKLMHNA